MTTLLEKIESSLSSIKRPCEISLEIIVLDTRSNKNANPMKDYLDNIYTNFKQETLESRKVVLEYVMLNRIHFQLVSLPDLLDNWSDFEKVLKSSDGVWILTDDSPESMFRIETILEYLIEKVRLSTQIAVSIETPTQTKGMRVLHWLSQLDLISQAESSSQSVQIFGLSQDITLEVLDWLGDLLDARTFLHGCTIQRIYVYDESGILVAFFADEGTEEDLTDPVLVTAVYRALETLFFDQQGGFLKHLSLDSPEHEDLFLAAVRHESLGALFVCAGKINQTLIWQIGIKIMQAIQQERTEKRNEQGNLPEVYYIQGKHFFEQLKPHLLGKCVKCRDLLGDEPSVQKIFDLLNTTRKPLS